MCFVVVLDGWSAILSLFLSALANLLFCHTYVPEINLVDVFQLKITLY